MNRTELRVEITRKELSNRFIAKELGISEQAFYNKISGVREFKESEIKKLIQLLELTPERVNEIFLV